MFLAFGNNYEELREIGGGEEGFFLQDKAQLVETEFLYDQFHFGRKNNKHGIGLVRTCICDF